MSNITKLKDVKPGMEKLNLTVVVVRVGEPKVVPTRYGQAKTMVASIKDETGSMNLKLWRDQVDLVKLGSMIEIENGFAAEFGGMTEVNVGSKGRITAVKLEG